MISIKCTYSNNDVIKTCINGNFQSARSYFLGKWFNFGDTDSKPYDDMHQCVSVELIGDREGNKLTYDQWLEAMDYVTDSEHRSRLEEDGFSPKQIEFKIAESHEIYENYLNQ